LASIRWRRRCHAHRWFGTVARRGHKTFIDLQRFCLQVNLEKQRKEVLPKIFIEQGSMAPDCQKVMQMLKTKVSIKQHTETICWRRKCLKLLRRRWPNLILLEVDGQRFLKCKKNKHDFELYHFKQCEAKLQYLRFRTAVSNKYLYAQEKSKKSIFVIW